MPTTISAVLAALLLIGWLDAGLGLDAGCALWLPSGQTDVCCQKCHPGNRLVAKCGENPKKLCVPCEEGTYMTERSLYSCSKCTQCKDAQVVKRACTSSSDTVCGCVEGYFCADAQCSRCTKQCGRGEQPTEKLTCQVCPEGTFNDQIHQKCTPWRTSCPLPGYHIVARGTALHDSICSNVSNNIALPEDDHDGKVTLVVVIGCLSVLAVVAVASIGAAACGIVRRKTKTTRKKQAAETPKEGPRWEQQVDCSLCHPQQEQGGSLSSVASQGSEDKLLPV